MFGIASGTLYATAVMGLANKTIAMGVDDIASVESIAITSATAPATGNTNNVAPAAFGNTYVVAQWYSYKLGAAPTANDAKFALRQALIYVKSGGSFTAADQEYVVVDILYPAADQNARPDFVGR